MRTTRDIAGDTAELTSFIAARLLDEERQGRLLPLGPTAGGRFQPVAQDVRNRVRALRDLTAAFTADLRDDVVPAVHPALLQDRERRALDGLRILAGIWRSHPDHPYRRDQGRPAAGTTA